jgi:beta-lactamase regulating signal transducer with metallopeptidase domain
MQSLLSVGLSNAVAATVLALVAFIVDRVIRRPAISHCFWLLVLLKLVTPPLVRVPLPWPSTPEPSAVSVDAAESSATAVPRAGSATGPEAVTAMADRPTPGGDTTPRAAPPSWPALLLAVWFAGSALWWAVAAVRVVRFGRLLRQSRAATGEVPERLALLARRMGLRRCPAVAFVPGTVSPLLWAPGPMAQLLLPRALWDRLDADQRDSLLVHELAHLRRRDHWVRRLELFAFGLYWWHPVAWWARRELEDAEERCCDGWVARVLPESAPAYAAALVETVAFLSSTRGAIPLGASGGGQARQLTRRVTMILEGKTAAPLGRLAFAAILVVGATLLALAPGGAEPPAISSVVAVEAMKPPPAAGIDFGPVQPDQFSVLHGDNPGLTAQILALKLRQLQQLEELARAERSPTADAARDEIERLEVQVNIRKAREEAEQLKLHAAMETLQRFDSANKRVPGSVPEAELAKAKNDVLAAEAELAVKRAERAEPEVLLKQARRRLAALERTKSITDDSSERRRLTEMEGKIKELRQEIESLRKKLGLQGSATPSKDSKGAALTGILSSGPTHRQPEMALVTLGTVIYTPHPSMKFPFAIEPWLRGRARTVSLLVSSDGGDTWKETASVAVGETRELPFNAPADGRYLVSVRVTDTEGKQFPSDSEITAHQTVVVDRKRPEIVFKASNANDELTIEWKIEEEHPDLASFLFEYRLGGEWKRLDVSPALTGHKVLKPGTTAVRLKIRDLAGNETTGVVDPMP